MESDAPVLAIDSLLAQRLSGPEKLFALLRASGFNMATYARQRGFWPEQVRMTLYGTRPYPEVRDALAQDLRVPREEIDRLLRSSSGGPAKQVA
jgi:lambda repressor-like predicted transcriptional regulator